MLVINAHNKDITPVFTGLLDSVGGAAGAWSVDLLSSDYTGALARVRRSSDNAETDVNPNSSNRIGLDSTVSAGGTLGTWVGSNSAYIVYWYGQETAGGTGSGLDLDRALSSSQPRIVNAGTLDTDPDNGNVAMFFDGIDDRLDLGSTLSVVQEYYQHLVFNRASSGIHSVSLAGTEWTWIWFSNNTIYSGTEADVIHDTAQTQTGDFIQTVLRDSSDNVKMWQNGSAKTTQTNSGATGNYTVAFSRAGFPHDGYVQELVYWASDQESNRSIIESDANTRFSVF